MTIVKDDIYVAKPMTDLSDVDQETKDKLRELGITDDPISDVEAGFYHVPDFCFFCGERILELPAIMWAGVHPSETPKDNHPQLWLHVGCVKTFCDRIMRDYNEIKLGKEKADRILEIQKLEEK